MLELINFIKEHKNWEELLSVAPYNLTIKRDGEYIIFKYKQISSDFNEKICKEARGIILENNTFKIVRLSFEKFFNIDEIYAAKIDWKSAVATSKEDGSLMSLWYNKGQWHLSTNNTIDAYKAEISNGVKYKNFGELFDAAAINSGLNLSKLNTNYCYTFELCSCYNRIVLNYDLPQLFHISTRDMTTLQEVEVDIGVKKPKIYKLNSEQDYRDCVTAMDDTHEGIVVRDACGNRVKIKTLSYFQLHKLATGVENTEKIVSIIRMNEQSEFLSYCPWLKERFNNVEIQIRKAEKIIEDIQNKVLEWKRANDSFDRKSFSLQYGKEEKSMLYFAAYDNVLNERIKKMNDRAFIRYFGITEI